ncbi:MAG: DNA primase DnaG [Desulfurococcaceae archaeon]
MAKYLIKARVEVDGIVEKHDIIGAIFGQTEGLLGNEFDLRALQDKGRIGRIQVNTRTHANKTVGEIAIPSNLDRVETALLAALVETVDKVGPYDSKIQVIDIVDLRLEKIRKIVERAVEILKKWGKEKTPDLKELVKNIQDMLKAPEPINYGPEELPAGPNIEKSDTLIIVEGRADVINLLRYGYMNVIAIGGARGVPETLKKLAENKKTIIFVDGDHGGDLILKDVLRNLKIDYIARAPSGKEVEELTGKEIEEALNKAQSVFEYLEGLINQGNKEAQYLLQMQKKMRKMATEEGVSEIQETITIPLKVIEDIKAIYGTLESILYDNEWNQIKRIPVRDLVIELDSMDQGKVYAILIDGIITQRLIDSSKAKDVKILIGARIGKLSVKPSEIIVLTFNEIGYPELAVLPK